MARYRYPFRVRRDKEFGIDLVDMKCLWCGHEEEAELDILLECSNPASDDSPVLICPECGRELLVPKDVCEQIKGGFVYKIEK